MKLFNGYADLIRVRVSLAIATQVQTTTTNTLYEPLVEFARGSKVQEWNPFA